MIAWTRLTAPALVCFVAWWGTPSLQASPVTYYSTWGTVDIRNEPYPHIGGVSGLAAFPDHLGQYTLGTVQITPVSDSGGSTIPNIANSPFDLHLSFSDSSMPSLEFKGVFNLYVGPFTKDLNWGYLGTVSSITSSNPSLDANLPVPFANALSNPDILQLHMGMWDWGIRELPLTLTIIDPVSVPEPSTLLVFGATAAAGFGLQRAKRRHRAK